MYPTTTQQTTTATVYFTCVTNVTKSFTFKVSEMVVRQSIIIFVLIFSAKTQVPYLYSASIFPHTKISKSIPKWGNIHQMREAEAELVKYYHRFVLVNQKSALKYGD